MHLIEHLGDLRKRITISLTALLIAFMVAFNYSEELFRSIMFPLKYNLSFSMENPFIRTAMNRNINGRPPMTPILRYSFVMSV